MLQTTVPLRTAIKILEGENKAYTGILLPTLYSLKYMLRDTYAENMFHYCEPLLALLRQSLHER